MDRDDAVISAPKSHKLIMENESVRVLEVIIPPKKKEPMHTHKWPSIMIIDSSTDINYYDKNNKVKKYKAQKATKDKPIYEWLGPEGMHAVENLDENKTYHAIRIEIKGKLPKNL